MKKLFRCLFLCFASLLSSIPLLVFATEQSYSVSNVEINKSERDNRRYEVIRLINGINVLLISDEKAVKSLGALALPIGSLYDPKLQQGLAHYTEHMVLMGSKKYPNPSDFSEYLSAHAGSYNASTTLNRTSFYFDVENSAFEGALDRLADAISEPLFDPKYADKERNAVNSEFTLSRSNDGFRIFQTDAETINQNHPASMFSGGNLETLSDKPNSQLHKELVDFHHNYYLPDIMSGVLYSNQSLNDLAQLAEKTFGRIQVNKNKIQKINQSAITKENVGKIIYMEPAQPKKVLYIQFPIENNLDKFADKSDEYIGYMIRNRSPNTLFDKLQKQGLIESINAYNDPIRYGTSGVFSIYVNLTDNGLAEKDRVLASIFSYLKLLKKEGIDKRYYDELQKVLALEFKYSDITQDMSYVEYLSDQMLLYPTQHILDADYVANHFNKQAIEQRLESLTLKNARIWFIAPNQKTDKRAKFLDVPYQIENISTSQINQIMKEADQLQFSLPLLNPYIPDRFEIDQKPTKEEQLINQPFNPKGNYFHFASKYFAEDPKAAVILSLRNNFVDDNVKNQVMFITLNYLVKRQLATLNFQADVAGIFIGTFNDSGIEITANGFNQHILALIEATLATYRTFDIKEEDLALAKSWYLERLDTADHANSNSLAMQPIYAIAGKTYFNRKDKRQAISTVTVEDLQNFRQQLLTNSVPYMLTFGNLSDQQALELYKTVKNHLNSDIEYYPDSTWDINHQINAIITQNAVSSDNALFMGFVPKGYDKIASGNISMLLSQIIYPWFYDQLRSNEQLGYVVSVSSFDISNSSGIGFLIQSNEHDPAYLNERYQAFYPVILERLNALSDAEFDNYKQSILNQWMMPAQTFYEEFGDYYVDYYDSLFKFDTKRKSIEQFKLLTKNDVIEFFKQSVIQQNGLTIASEVIGNQPDKELNHVKGLTPYQNAAELQRVLSSL